MRYHRPARLQKARFPARNRGSRGVDSRRRRAVASRSRRQGEPESTPEAETTAVGYGFSVQELTSADKKELNFDGKTGILITKVDPGSFAEDIGLREGDIITHMNRQAVAYIADLKGLQSNLKPGDAVAFRVLRNLSQGGADWQAFFAAGAVPNQ